MVIINKAGHVRINVTFSRVRVTTVAARKAAREVPGHFARSDGLRDEDNRPIRKSELVNKYFKQVVHFTNSIDNEKL